MHKELETAPCVRVCLNVYNNRLLIYSCFVYKTEICTQCVHNSTISIPATSFGHYISLVSEYNTPNYLKHKLFTSYQLNLLKPNDIYICCTAALTSRRYILNIYSTNIHTGYFIHAA